MSKEETSASFDVVMSQCWELQRDQKVGSGEVDQVARMLHTVSYLHQSFKPSSVLEQKTARFRLLCTTGKLSSREMAAFYLIVEYRNLQQYRSSLTTSTWALQQGPKQISLITFGVIIKILAMCDDTSERCEKLYSDALEYIPHGFCLYDLSHGAIHPDRSKHLDIGKAAFC